MMRNFFFRGAVFAVLALFAFPASAATPGGDPGRTRLIRRALDDISRRMEEDEIADLAAEPVATEPAAVPEDEEDSYLKAAMKRRTSRRTGLFEKMKSYFPKLDVSRSELTSLEIGVQMQTYHYEQEQHRPYYYWLYHTIPLQVTNDGRMGGIYASYTHRLSRNKPVKTLKDFFSQEDKVNFFKVDVSYTAGTVDSDISFQDSQKGFGIKEFEARGLVGYDFPSQDDTLLVTPFFGIGYRYLLRDDVGGWVDVVSEYWNYDQEMQYCYLPIGLQARKDLGDDWELGMSVEYDFLFYGRLTSHFEENGYTITGTGVAAGKNLKLDQLGNTQDNGFGIRLSGKIVKKQQPFDIVFEPYLKYWNIRSSDPRTYEATAEDGSSYYFYKSGDASNRVEHYEPANTTTEYGVRIGLRY